MTSPRIPVPSIPFRRKRYQQKCPIGIDLGTSNIRLGIWKEGKVKVVSDWDGSNQIPSYVRLNGPGDTVVGVDAKSNAALYPHVTFSGVKKIIGLPLDKFSSDEKFSAVNISSVFLKHVKDIYIGQTEDTFGGNLEAIITVPSYFKQSQRLATEKAATDAGFTVIRLLDESVAAAIAFANLKSSELVSTGETPVNVFVFDMGGASLNTSVLSMISGSVFEKLGADCFPELGGSAFDDALRTVVTTSDDMKMIELGSKDQDQLSLECERAKIQLSYRKEVDVEVPTEHLGHTQHVNVKRDKFDAACSDLYNSAIGGIDKTLGAAGKTIDEISHVLLVGGGCHIPGLQTRISDKFPGKVVFNLPYDELVAIGATIYADRFERGFGELGAIIIKERTHMDIGVAITGTSMIVKMIEKDTELPHSAYRCFYTYDDNQEDILIQVYMGNSLDKAEGRTLLCDMMLENLPPHTAETLSITVGLLLSNKYQMKIGAIVHPNNGKFKMLGESQLRVDLPMQEGNQQICKELMYQATQLLELIDLNPEANGAFRRYCQSQPINTEDREPETVIGELKYYAEPRYGLTETTANRLIKRFANILEKTNKFMNPEEQDHIVY